LGKRSRKRSADRPRGGRGATRPVRGGERASGEPAGGAGERASGEAAAPGRGRSLRSPRRRTGEERSEAIRAALEPLAPGERPGAVTAAAIVAAVLAVANLVAYLAGVKIDGERPAAGAMVATEALLGVMAAGMWLARYWAVLGFQFLLGLLLASLALLLVTASSLAGVAVVLAIGIPAGFLFWKLVRAMARIQMPEPPRAQR